MEPVSPLYYNDQPPEMIFYQGMAFKESGQEEQAEEIFHKLVDYGQTHLSDQIGMDYFAVSLPDFLVFDEDLDRRNRIHCHFMMGLGCLGLGRFSEANDHFEKVLALAPHHIGATFHRALCGDV